MAENTPLPDRESESSFSDSGEEPKTSPHDLIIDVLGKKFSITTDKKSEYLNEVLAQYQIAVANTQGISGMKDDPLKVAILTGFLLCDEINEIKLQLEHEQAEAELLRADEAQELNRITQNIIARIDQLFT